MKSLFLSVSISLFCFMTLQAQHPASIQGVIQSSLKIKGIYLNYQVGEVSVTDSAVVKNKRFHFTFDVSEPTFAMIRIWYTPKIEGQRGSYEAKQLFLEAGVPMKIVINDSLKNAGITGWKAIKDFQNLQSMLAPFEKQSRKLNDQNRIYWKEKDSAGMNKISEALEELDSRMKEEVYFKFFKNNPKSPIGLYVLEKVAGYDIDPYLIGPLFKQLSIANQESASGIAYKNRIEAAKKTAVGAMAINFTQNDTLENPVSLLDFRGQYVLVDFWASWCGPCRADNPGLVKAYQEFKDKGFTVLGISLDRSGHREDWLKAIHTDKLTWTHVSDLQFWNNAVAKAYGIQAIPQNFLIDPNGKIVATNLKGSTLYSKLSDLLK